MRRKMLSRSSQTETAGERSTQSTSSTGHTFRQDCAESVVLPLAAYAPPAEPSLRPTLRPWIDVIDQIIQEDAALTKRLRTTRSCAIRPADVFPLTACPMLPIGFRSSMVVWSPRSAFGIHCLWWQTMLSSEPEHQSASELQMVLHVRCAVLQLGPQPLGL